MATPELRPAQLDDQSLARVREMERELGSVIIAYQAEPPFMSLSADQLRRLQELERELGVVLLAYKPAVAAGG